VNNSPLIVALDHATSAQALTVARQLDPATCRVKVANTLFVRSGPKFIESLTSMGFDVFLDLKFHDIPMQVAGSVLAAADMGVWMLNVHTAGGPAMMRAAAQVLENRPARPYLIGVTVLTSLDASDLRAVGIAGEPVAAVRRMADLARDCGLDGIVCSPQELPVLRTAFDPPFLMVTPGIRPTTHVAGTDDQKRVMTPALAREAGADYLVVGRPITEAESPMDVVASINETLQA
jgi:orotidine-5'-phosphate decarboxylase